MEQPRCKLWLPKKNRFCANLPLNESPFCGNHTVRSDSKWIPCPIDSSQYLLSPLPCFVTRDVQCIHASVCNDIEESYKTPEACNMWINREIDRKLPFQERHVIQQASILGNLEDFGVLKRSYGNEQSQTEGEDHDDRKSAPAVVEFGAGRGYLTQTLADCYRIRKVFLVERKSYKLKVSDVRSHQRGYKHHIFEDLDLKAVESLHGVHYLAIGKHLCGPATDLTLRCCLPERVGLDAATEGGGEENPYLEGFAIATCCHHLCQWKHYINKEFMLSLGISKEEFHAITWFTSWAVDGDHGAEVSESGLHLHLMEKEQSLATEATGVDGVVRNMKAVERAALGFMCKQIIDKGRMAWGIRNELETHLVKYVTPTISPENHLLIAKRI
ncbi:tRNA:m(4)X modification enzyme TRM13 [Linum grandiflorum]